MMSEIEISYLDDVQHLLQTTEISLFSNRVGPWCGYKKTRFPPLWREPCYFYISNSRLMVVLATATTRGFATATGFASATGFTSATGFAAAATMA